jgi:hypothetical protein
MNQSFVEFLILAFAIYGVGRAMIDVVDTFWPVR